MGKSVIDLSDVPGEAGWRYVEELGDEITSVRIYRLEDAPFGPPSAPDDDDPETPWQMDGIDVRVTPPLLTEECWNFTSFEKAIASVTDSLTHYTLVAVTSDPPCSHEIRGTSGDCAACGQFLDE